MMSATASIIILEIALVFLVIIGVLVFFSWKRKKRQSQEFEQLLEIIDQGQAERKVHLINSLVKNYAMGKTEAKESGEYMVEAEKQFIQQFIKQQMEQTTVTEFYRNLCELLDQYLYFVPKLVVEEKKEEVETVENNVKKTETEQEIVEPESNTDQDNEEVITDNSTNAEGEVEQVKEDASSEPEEPDWGEAFSESGDEMDEDAKQGYEEEVKKE